MKEKKIVLTILTFIIAIIFVIMGLLQGGYKMTQGKGSVICWECIGLGQD